MKTCALLAVVLVLAVDPVRADEPDKLTSLRGEIEFLEIEQDVDKTLLREAMLNLGRNTMAGLAGSPPTEERKMRIEAELAGLEKFIAAKKAAVLERSAVLRARALEVAELQKAAARPKPAPRPAQTQAAAPRDEAEDRELARQVEDLQVEEQLLGAKTQYLKLTLNQTIDKLAALEVGGDGDEAQRQKKTAETRKTYDEIRRNYVEHMAKLKMGQEKLYELRRKLNQGQGGFQ
jgi:hypothetical protein